MDEQLSSAFAAGDGPEMFAEGYGDDKSLSVAVGKVITNRLLSTKSENSPKNRLQQERRVK